MSMQIHSRAEVSIRIDIRTHIGGSSIHRVKRSEELFFLFTSVQVAYLVFFLYFTIVCFQFVSLLSSADPT